MPGAGHRAVAAATALLLVVGGILAALSQEASAASSGTPSGHHVAHRKPGHHATARHRAAGHRERQRGDTSHRPRSRKPHGPASREPASRRPGTRAEVRARRRAEVRERRRAEQRAAEARERARVRTRWAKVEPRRPSTWVRWAPDHYTPPPGPRFNDPYAGRPKRRALLRHVIRTIDSAPGYRLVNPVTHRRMRCPTNPRQAPSTIMIAVYSVADMSFADALSDAQRRCVSVKVLMNSHLDAITSHSWGRIVKALGRRPRDWDASRSFAMRCTNGCLGTSVLHAKLFLFSRAGRARDVVITGSSNMTRNAVRVQWNDLFTVEGNRRLYDQFSRHFRQMVPDRPGSGPWAYHAGHYRTTFNPAPHTDEKSDDVMRTLRNVTCTGARGGAGIHGRTVLYIAMHAWFGVRGHYLAEQVRRLQRQGCYVRILYSFLSRRTYDLLGAGRAPRMQLLRVQFPGALGLVAVKYSHMKMLAISGHLGRNRSAWVTWTGSDNWTDRGDRADEVTLRISSRAVYRAYVRHWKHIRHTRSSALWAKYPEPAGGGRAP